MQPESRKSKFWLVALVFLAVVSLLAALKPPTPHTPFVKIDHPAGFSLNVVLLKKSTLDQCRIALTTVQGAYLQHCPDCRLMDWACVASVGPSITTIQSNSPLKNYSLRFGGGDIVFGGTQPLETMQLACESAAKSSGGHCYPPHQVRTASRHQAGNPYLRPHDPIAIDRFLGALAATAALSFALCLLLVVSKPLHRHFSLDDQSGVQRFHGAETPRIGGLGILIALVMSVMFFAPLSFDQKAELIWPAVFAGLAAFVFGFAEDVTKSVGVVSRLLATMGSAVLAWWLTGVSLEAVDVAPFDALLSLKILSVAFTALAVGGVANAINIIDGFHGLASGVAMIILMAFGIVAYSVGDISLAVFAAVLAAAVLGFFLVNYPFGKLFLGDGGAYYLGFLIAWIGVLLPVRNPDVSPWVSLLICAYPIVETLFTVYRRIQTQALIGAPDRRHLHSLIKLCWIEPRFQNWSIDMQNSLVAPWMVFFSCAPVIVAVIYFSNTVILISTFFCYCLAYQALYFHTSRRLIDPLPSG